MRGKYLASGIYYRKQGGETGILSSKSLAEVKSDSRQSVQPYYLPEELLDTVSPENKISLSSKR